MQVARRDSFDHVVIETTGLANPAPIIETFVAFPVRANAAPRDVQLHTGALMGSAACCFAVLLFVPCLGLLMIDEHRDGLSCLFGVRVVRPSINTSVRPRSILRVKTCR